MRVRLVKDLERALGSSGDNISPSQLNAELVESLKFKNWHSQCDILYKCLLRHEYYDKSD